MKEQLASADIRVIVSELSEKIVGARIDKVFQTGHCEIILRLFGSGRQELVAAPNFMCLTRYRRPAPKDPSSFSMQLRKHLKGKPIESIVQPGFERIVEIGFKDRTLVFELFSKGNVFLLSKDRSILGLINWQKWRDRTLGVGKQYEYPPPKADPFKASREDMDEALMREGKTLAAVLATEFSLGGAYAERVAHLAGIDPVSAATDADGDKVWEALKTLLAIMEGEPSPKSNEETVEPYPDFPGGVAYDSFNEAVDEFFSKKQVMNASLQAEKSTDERKKNLEGRLDAQKNALAEAELTITEEKMRGDLLYQRMGEVQAIIDRIHELRASGLSDERICVMLKDEGIFIDLKKFELKLDL